MDRRAILLIASLVGLAAFGSWLLRDVEIELRPDMPPAGRPGAPGATTVTVLGDGSIRIGGARTTPEDLSAAVAKAGQGQRRDQQIVFVSADASAPFETVDAVWRRLKADGWTRVYRIDPTDDGGDG